MQSAPSIPVFTLFGETRAFPDVVHCEQIAERAPRHHWTIAPHRHAQMAQLFCIHSGHAKARVDGRPLEFSDNQALFVPAQAVHEFTFAPQTCGLVISIPMTVLRSTGPAPEDLSRALSTAFLTGLDAALSQMTALLSERLDGTGRFRAQAAVALTHAILAHLAERAPALPGSGASDARLGQVDALIAQHMSDGWRASDYAAALSLTTGHLSRLCRAAHGVGAAAYIEQKLMEEAARQLAFTRLGIAEIGFRLGFDDPSYFSKRFRARIGQTPSAYRSGFLG